MFNIALLNTVMLLLWYVSFGMFVLYKYTSFALQLKSVLSFAWKCTIFVYWGLGKTYDFILERLGYARHIQSLPQFVSPKPKSFWTRCVDRVGRFFGVNKSPTNVVDIEQVTDSNVFNYQSNLASDSQRFGTGDPRLDKLLNADQSDSTMELEPLISGSSSSGNRDTPNHFLNNSGTESIHVRMSGFLKRPLYSSSIYHSVPLYEP
jgi:hypothetical protein